MFLWCELIQLERNNKFLVENEVKIKSSTSWMISRINHA